MNFARKFLAGELTSLLYIRTCLINFGVQFYRGTIPCLVDGDCESIQYHCTKKSSPVNNKLDFFLGGGGHYILLQLKRKPVFSYVFWFRLYSLYRKAFCSLKLMVVFLFQQNFSPCFVQEIFIFYIQFLFLLSNLFQLSRIQFLFWSLSLVRPWTLGYYFKLWKDVWSTLKGNL